MDLINCHLSSIDQIYDIFLTNFHSDNGQIQHLWQIRRFIGMKGIKRAINNRFKVFQYWKIIIQTQVFSTCRYKMRYKSKEFIGTNILKREKYNVKKTLVSEPVKHF